MGFRMQDCPLIEEDRLKLDAAKIHNEINLLGNVRLLVSLGMMPFAGLALTAWSSYSIPRSVTQCLEISFKAVGYWFVVVALYCIFCAAMTRIRLYAAYLRVKGLSCWEDDWCEFRFGEIRKEDIKFRNNFLSVDMNGFASIFHVFFVLMLFQCGYMLCVIYKKINFVQLWCGKECLGQWKIFLYSMVPVMVLVFICVYFWKRTKMMKRIMSKDHEIKLAYIWSYVLRDKA